MIAWSLSSLEQTALLGRLLARALLAEPSVRLLLLSGPLGAGKTTLVRSLTAALPGGERAEVSSPSFTLCNYYPTRPPMLHCDLYRSGSAVPDELLDALEDGETVTVVEWAEYLPEPLLPEEYLDIRLKLCHEERLVMVAGHGEATCRAVSGLQLDHWME